MLTPRLSEDQLEVSDVAESQGQSFAQVQPSQLFGPQADGVLAQQVYRLNPARYRALREEYEYQIGAKRRPLDFWK